MQVNRTVMVLQDPDDPAQLVLDLGLELCETLGWKPGDQLEWIDNMDGSWTLKRTDQS